MTTLSTRHHHQQNRCLTEASRSLLQLDHNGRELVLDEDARQPVGEGLEVDFGRMFCDRELMR